MESYDVIVVGGGHAGVEAAYVAARMGMNTLLVTLSMSKIGELSCNPSMGGIAKANIVRDVDILGGLIGFATDRAAVSYRVLNRRKGPAVRATRAQLDRGYYRRFVQTELFRKENISILEDEVIDILVSSGSVCGVLCAEAGMISCKAVVVATGTFLNGLIHIGTKQVRAGRMGEKSSSNLVDALRRLGLRILRFKTGTPPRVLKSSVDLSKMIEQKGESDYIPFSIRTRVKLDNMLSCYLTFTTKKTHDIILKNLHLSALYGGRIKGIGPRYCPSIEDKVVKFSHNPRHHVFVEPEGWFSPFYYLNGLSMSMPYEVQLEIVRSVPGLEDAEFSAPAYAIEYDLIDPKMLSHTLEYKNVRGLFFAGQINGSSGYEEAAGQGIVAGINAALYVRKAPPFCLGRHESYIGVMIDDLVSRGVDEPYRLFTARAEHRLLLREDNVQSRLLQYAERYKLLDDDLLDACKSEEETLKNLLDLFSKRTIAFDEGKRVSYFEYLTISENSARELCEIDRELSYVPEQLWRRLKIEALYRGYIERERKRIKSERELSSVKIPKDFDYSLVRGLTREGREKFTRLQPKDLLEAFRIPGIRLSDILLLYIHLKRGYVSYETSGETR